MAWTFRKRFKVGPFNVNLSRSGVGFSAGAGPFRAGVDARGRRYTNVRGPFGLNNRQYYKTGMTPIEPQPEKSHNGAAVRDAFIVLIISAVSLVIYIKRALGADGQNLVLALTLLTAIPGALGVYGYFANKDARSVWFQVVAAVLKIEKWLALGCLLLLLTAGDSKKRR
jgi:hypothetical protein